MATGTPRERRCGEGAQQLVLELSSIAARESTGTVAAVSGGRAPRPPRSGSTPAHAAASQGVLCSAEAAYGASSLSLTETDNSPAPTAYGNLKLRAT